MSVIIESDEYNPNKSFTTFQCKELSALLDREYLLTEIFHPESYAVYEARFEVI